MNIDIFSSGIAKFGKSAGQAGLLLDRLLPNTPAAVLYDAQTYQITIEFLEEEPLHTNIEVEPDLSPVLLKLQEIYYGGIENSAIGEALTLPLIVLNDPYGTPMSLNNAPPVTRRLKQFDAFIKSAKYAQPIHREDISDEAGSLSILHGMDRSALDFSPKLLRQVQLGIGPQTPAPQPTVQPQAAPSLGQGSGGAAVPAQRPGKPKKSDDS